MCDYGYALSIINTSCISCSASIANCEDCIASTVCKTCYPMYYVNAGNCVLCSVGCLTCLSGTICEVCIDTYTLLANKTCQLCENSIIGCQICSSNSVCINCI